MATGQHFENLRKSSEMVGNLRKIVEILVISSFDKINKIIMVAW